MVRASTLHSKPAGARQLPDDPLEHAPVSEHALRQALADVVFPANHDDVLDVARENDDTVAEFLADFGAGEFESLDHLVDTIRSTLEATHTSFDSGLALHAHDTIELDINQADVEAFEAIEGIDRDLAERIVQVRAARGGEFHTIDEVFEVGGIDLDTLERLRRSAAI